MVLGWFIGPGLLIFMIWGNTNKDLSTVGAVLFTGLGKTAWSIGVAWMIIACSTGHGGKYLFFFRTMYFSFFFNL